MENPEEKKIINSDDIKISLKITMQIHNQRCNYIHTYIYRYMPNRVTNGTE